MRPATMVLGIGASARTQSANPLENPPSVALAPPTKTKTVTFEVPLAPAQSLLAGPKPPSEKLEQLSPEATAVLARAWEKKADGEYVVSDAKMQAAKRELLRFWGFPKHIVEHHVEALRLNQVQGTQGAVGPALRVTGTIDRMSFEGWLDRANSFSADDIQRVVARLDPVLPEKITLGKHFLARLGLSAEESEAVATRLTSILKAWMDEAQTSDAQIAWAKDILLRGLGLEREATAVALRALVGTSALGADGRVRGDLTLRDGTVEAFVAFPATSIVLRGNALNHYEVTSKKGAGQ